MAAVFDCNKIKIQKGDKNDNVKKLQEYLKKWGYYNYNVDSDFGDKTHNAVKAFQKAYKIKETGVFEGDTCKKFNQVVEAKLKAEKNNNGIIQFDCPKTSIKKKSKDANGVKKLQTMLIKLDYYKYKLDGDFGDETEKSLKAFQKDKKLTQTGELSGDTCKELNKAYKAKIEKKKQKKTIFKDDTPEHLRRMTAKLTCHPEVVVLPDVELDGSNKSVTEGATNTNANFDCSKMNLKKGSKGEDVKKLQNILKSKGYYTRQVDGDFGQYTEEAVKKLQEVQGNSKDGIFGPKTCNKLHGNKNEKKQKKKDYIISQFKSVTTQNDNDGLTYEVTLTTPYTKDKLDNIRKLQKTTFELYRGKEEVYHHEGYINDIKINMDNEEYLIDIQVVGYTAFLQKTLTNYEKTAKRSELLVELIEFAGLVADVDLSGLPDDTFTLKTQETTNNTGTTSAGAGLTQMSGSDCTGHMQTNQISARSYDINSCGGNTKIGNSSANYAQDTAHMTAKEAILDVYNRFKYGRPGNSSVYYDNERCPRLMWNKTGKIYGNCADISRLIKCVGEVHGLKVGIRHCPNHYYNLVEVDGQTYKFDCCFKSGVTGSSYGGEVCNTLTKHGGPWQ